MDPFLDEESGGKTGFDPLSLLRMFWRRKLLFLVPFVLCLAMAGVAIKTMTPIFESTGQIRVVHELTTSRLIEDDSRQFRRVRDIDRETMANVWTILTAPKFLEAVVLQTQLYTGTPRLASGGEDVLPEALTADEMAMVRTQAARLARQIRVRQDGHHIFQLGVRDTDPRHAFVLARVILDRFLEEERASRIAPRTTTRDFLTRQRETYAESLKVMEDSLAVFQRGVLSESLAGNPVNAANINHAESGLLRLQDQYYNADVNEMARLEQQATRVAGTLPDIRPIMRNPDVGQAMQELRDLEFSRLLAVTDGTAGNAMGQTRLRLNDLVDGQVQRDYPQLGLMDRSRMTQYIFFMVSREGKKRALDLLSSYIRSYKDFTTRQPVLAARLEEFQEEVAGRRDMLESIEREIAQQTINLEASMSEIGYRIEVRRDPTSPRIPVEPDKLKLGFMAFVLSLAIGVGLVVLSILLDRTFTSVQEIESTLGLKVIGTLPVIQDEHFQQRRRLRLMRWSILVVVILLVAALFLLYIYPRLS